MEQSINRYKSMALQNVAIIGSSGAIGRALTQQLATMLPDATIYTFSRSESGEYFENIIHTTIKYESEISIESAARIASERSPLDMVLVATGILHDEVFMPEKSLKDLSAEKFIHLFLVNSVLPAIIAKHFIPRLNQKKRSVFAALSARVGSISDNKMGGWYSYRASKSALNMIIKNVAIETARKNEQAIIVGLHPGTVDSNLSRPFQSYVSNEKLFTPDFAARKLIEVLETLTPGNSGKCFAWDGKEIEA
jgi:NAD(P)-dependent dehydrogenase (short-subunit alcohol dehydrogenase family)